MPHVDAGALRIAYDERGEGEPLVLLMGLAWPRVYWDDAFCDRLAAKGFRVIRMDARDVGESDFLEEMPPNIGRIVQAAFAGESVEAPYSLSDMALDVVGLLDALGIERAHVCGSSLGGMVAQTLAIEHPGRLSSLTSIMSSTGDRALPLGTPAAMEILFTPIPAERDAAVAHQVASFRIFSASAFDEARATRLAERGFDLQAHVPPLLRQTGAARQLAAMLTSGDRVQALGQVAIPSLIVHGSDDPLVPLAAGQQTAECIPGARMLEIEGMGHDLAPPFWDTVIGALKTW
ncbi:MAG: alpha/beta fold hydrolase [Myxococcota bacterium]